MAYVLEVDNHGNSGFRLITNKLETTQGAIVLQQFHIKPQDIERAIEEWEKLFFDVERKIVRNDIV